MKSMPVVDQERVRLLQYERVAVEKRDQLGVGKPLGFGQRHRLVEVVVPAEAPPTAETDVLDIEAPETRVRVELLNDGPRRGVTASTGASASLTAEQPQTPDRPALSWTPGRQTRRTSTKQRRSLPSARFRNPRSLPRSATAWF